MRRRIICGTVGLLFLAAAYPPLNHAQSDQVGGPILEFNTMFAVAGPYVGATNPIRTVPGGGAPWAIGSGGGALWYNGQLSVHTQGLVVAATGANPAAMFQVIVSCQSIDGSGAADVVNVSTAPFPADANGNSLIDTTVDLPSPCIAPIVFVASTRGAWFAATGR